jgi:hypothetical protein
MMNYFQSLKTKCGSLKPKADEDADNFIQEDADDFIQEDADDFIQEDADDIIQETAVEPVTDTQKTQGRKR